QGGCAVAISPNGFAFSHITNHDVASFNTSRCEFIAGDDLNGLGKELTTRVMQHNLQHADCNIVLHPDYYRLLLLDAPQVPEEEYNAALKWRIKEMVDFPFADTALDFFFPIKLSDTEHQSKKVYVVVAQQSLLQTMVQKIKHCQLNPYSIDIYEFAWRNLLSLLTPEDDQVVALLHILPKKAVLLFVRDQEVVFTRHIICDCDKLAVEIKSCFEYYQHHIDHVTPRQLLLAPFALENRDNFTAELSQTLNLPLKDLQVNDLQQADCCVAIGGALRSEEE
ncbi:MAG: pilus assembly protein PilM, partial [Gammaproteobacteria bacterium]|nr:pilus assembly protein PilM [Gammaproteobacteria bacterium]